MARLSMVATFILLSIAIGVGSYIGYRNVALEQGFDSVTPGELRRDIIRRLGKPSSVDTSCQDEVTWLDQQVDKSKCIQEIRYDAILLPKYWTIGFDKNKRAVAKYNYVSP